MISIANYELLVEPHRRASRQLALELDFFLRDMGNVDVYDVQHRIKSYESAVRKASQLGVDIQDLDDVAGIRIIVGTSKEVPVVERFITRQEYGKDLKILKRRDLAKSDGYNALHLVVELMSHYKRSIYPGRVEVQIHTVFAHAFNFLSRSWRYKQTVDAPDSWNEAFLEVSKQLSHLERKAANLHEALVSTTVDENDGALTPHSLGVVIQQEFGEKLPMEDLVDGCGMYVGVGYQTISKVRAFFRRTDVSELYDLVHSVEGNEILKPFQMEKSHFWGLFGIRMPNPRLTELIEHLIESGGKIVAKVPK